MNLDFEMEIQKAVNVLKQGGVIVYPTETSYGLGCDATNSSAVKKVLDVKNRSGEKGLGVIIDSIKSADEYIDVFDVALHLMKKFWPGALNIILPIKKNTPIFESCSVNNAQSIRVSSHPITSRLATLFGKPIVATSANLSGRSDIYNINDLEVDVDFVLDVGELKRNKPSTTVVVGDDDMKVLRQGEIKI